MRQAAGFLGGCVYKKETVPSASPPTTVVVTPPAPRVVSYAEGRYQLYGDGVATPFYWVWIPGGAAPPAPPAPPLLPR